MAIQIEVSLPDATMESAHTATTFILAAIKGSGFTVRHVTQTMFLGWADRIPAGRYNALISLNETEYIESISEAKLLEDEVVNHLKGFLGAAWDIMVA